MPQATEQEKRQNTNTSLEVNGFNPESRSRLKALVSEKAGIAYHQLQGEWGGEGIDYETMCSFLKGLSGTSFNQETREREPQLSASQYLHYAYDKETASFLLGRQIRDNTRNERSMGFVVVGTEGARYSQSDDDILNKGRIEHIAKDSYASSMISLRNKVISSAEGGEIDPHLLQHDLNSAMGAVRKILDYRSRLSTEGGRGVGHYPTEPLTKFPYPRLATTAVVATSMLVACAPTPPAVIQEYKTQSTEQQSGNGIPITGPDDSSEQKLTPKPSSTQAALATPQPEGQTLQGTSDERNDPEKTELAREEKEVQKSPTPTETKIPTPDIPEDLISNSYGILDENSFRKEGDNWVLVSKTSDDEEGDVIFRWDPRTQEWRAVRNFWECGNSPMPGNYAPTGLLRKEEEVLDSFQVQARACLLEVDSYPDPNYPEHALRGKLGFYDNQKDLHVIDFMSGGVFENGTIARGVISQRDSFSDVHRLQERNDLSMILNDYLDAGVETTRQVDITIITKSMAGWIFLEEHLQKYEEINKQLENAIRTGRNFPEVPEGYLIYVVACDITPRIWSLVPKTR